MRNNLHKHIKSRAAILLLCSLLTNCRGVAEERALELDADPSIPLTEQPIMTAEEEAIHNGDAEEVTHHDYMGTVAYRNMSGETSVI